MRSKQGRRYEIVAATESCAKVIVPTVDKEREMAKEEKAKAKEEKEKIQIMVPF